MNYYTIKDEQVEQLLAILIDYAHTQGTLADSYSKEIHKLHCESEQWKEKYNKLLDKYVANGGEEEEEK